MSRSTVGSSALPHHADLVQHAPMRGPGLLRIANRLFGWLLVVLCLAAFTTVVRRLLT